MKLMPIHIIKESSFHKHTTLCRHLSEFIRYLWEWNSCFDELCFIRVYLQWLGVAQTAAMAAFTGCCWGTATQRGSQGLCTWWIVAARKKAGEFLQWTTEHFARRESSYKVQISLCLFFPISDCCFLEWLSNAHFMHFFHALIFILLLIVFFV